MNKTRLLTTAVTAGVIGGMVKMGYESLLPPRTPEREKETPPETLLKQIGVPEHIRNLTCTYSGHQLPITTYIVHHGFSIGASVPYALLLEKFPKVGLGKGSLYGTGVFVLFHELLLPLTKTIPTPDKQPVEEHLSEFLGHIVWMYTIDRIIKSERK
ncbi:DUF1440 domain-containing protein [Macrococcoides bohemicum]|uniref:DUF1440 domain-containing protein n=1 Tax=Macrococcoides bohemicum TaxID=1903056 RepID=A0A328A5Z3_9STAP|nr:DUF1440 domain-containing protein [Macrococcus bohemicus]RAK49889.1 DUF1440 domain-containing protein [Macrococcus bohemicus]